MRVCEQVPLAPLTTLGVGGVAARMAFLETEDHVPIALAEATRRGKPTFVLGGGSNLVVGDAGFPGTVLRMAIRGVTVERDGSRVLLEVGAGENWDDLVERAVTEGWSGIECLSGIPGQVGATPIQNVGAYGQEVSQTLVSVRAFDRATSQSIAMSAEECRFGYRSSLFRRNDRYVVLAATFQLEAANLSAPIRYGELSRALGVAEGERAPIGAVRETVIALRKAKGMVVDSADGESKSAGSFFINPVLNAGAYRDLAARAGSPPPRFDGGEGRVKVPAAWLIEQAGYPKGRGAGQVGVSRKHALALVNRGGATASEVLAFAREVQGAVSARFGVVLDPEPVLVGCSW